MSMDFDAITVSPPQSLAHAVETMVQRWRSSGFSWSARLLAMTDDGAALSAQGGWKASVDRWPGVMFSASRSGPALDVAIEVIAGGRLRVTTGIGSNALRSLIANDAVRSYYYAPLVQAAAGLNARWMLGDLNLDFEPETEEDVERAIWSGPQNTGDPAWLSVIRQDTMSAEELARRTGDRFVVHDFVDGYWVLEHRDYLDYYGRG